MRIQDGETILFIGDSITDCSRSRPVGRGTGLGGGYVSLLDSMLSANYPEKNIDVLNLGINGNRITDLERRWTRDVIDLGPDWLIVLIGINDVWRQFDRPLDLNQITPKIFENTYRGLLKRSHPSVKELILISPYLIESDRKDLMRVKMNKYGSIVERIAKEFNAVFVDLQASFDRYLECRDRSSISDDRVHLNKIGHMKIASQVLESLHY